MTTTSLDGAEYLALDPAAQGLLFLQARSATEFADEPVSDAQLQASYDLMKYGPTALNQQPMRIAAVRSRESRMRLLRHLSERNRHKTAHAPLTVILAADIDFHEKLPQVFPHAPGLRDVLAADREDRVIQARFNATLQIGYFMLAVRAAGLAVGPMTGFDAAALDRDFFPGGSLQSLLVVNLGRGLPRRFARLPRLDYRDVARVV
jgi:3-hydroxypropanoate dehydrogenase